MAVRRESVHLELTGNFVSELAAHSAAVRAFRNDLDGLGRINIRTNISSNSNTINRLGADSRRTGDSINQLTGRLGLFADGLLTLGPALIPVVSQLAPAASGLALIGASAGVALASTVTAFQGVGDAVKAVREYQLEPTTENLQKAKEVMDQLGPAARAFVVEWREFSPVLTGIRNAAADGLFPGVVRALDELEDAGPRIERLFNGVAEATGNVMADGAESLTGPRWWDFWNYLEAQAPSVITRVSAAVGDLAHGLGQMLINADPGSQSFIRWFGDVAEGFDKWASSAEGRESVQGFLEYARQHGPQVAEFFTAIGGTVAAIVRAGEPLAGPMLDALTTVAEVFRTIAESDLATPILAAVTAMRVYSRVAAASLATQGRFTSAVSPWGRVAPPPLTQTQLNSLSGLPPHLIAALRAPHPQAIAAQRRAQMAAIGRGAGLAAGVGLIGTGVADSVGLSGTATGLLTGAMIGGPWGAGVGAAIGLVKDFTSANDDLEASLEGVNGALAAGDFAGAYAGLDQARQERDDYFDSWQGKVGIVSSAVSSFTGIEMWSDPAKDASDAYAETARQVALTDSAVADLGRSLGMTIGETDRSARSIEELQGVMERARPAMDALGLSQEDLTKAFDRQQTALGADRGAAIDLIRSTDMLEGFSDGQLNRIIDRNATGYTKMIDRIRDKMLQLDSDAGRLNAVSTAIRELGSEALTSAEKADQLAESIEALIGPGRDAEAALDGYREAVRALGDLNVDAGFTAPTKAAAANRQNTAEWQADLAARVTTMAGDGADPEAVVRTILKARRTFVSELTKEGFDFSEIASRLRALDFDKLLGGVLKSGDFDRATVAAFELQGALKGMPKNVRTQFLAEGIPKTRAAARQLAQDYELTEGQRRALMTLVDRASPGLRNIKAALDEAAKPRLARVSLAGNAGAQLAGIRSALAQIDGSTATAYVTVTRTYRSGVQPNADGGFYSDGVRAFADGGWGANGRYYDRSPQIVPGGADIRWGEKETGWEAYISGKPGQRERNVAVLGEAAKRLGVAVVDEESVRRQQVAEASRRAQIAEAVRFANRNPRPASAPTRVAVDVTGMRVEGTLQTPWGPAQIDGIARAVAREEIDADRAFESAHGR